MHLHLNHRSCANCPRDAGDGFTRNTSAAFLMEGLI